MLSTIGSGGFGTVYRVKDKSNTISAVKRVIFELIEDNDKQKVYREVKSLVKVESEYVVQYINSWRETDCLYIQMEWCSESLSNILKLKALVFDRNLGEEPMDLYEYYISCEIFREILECVQYLHELNPQIIHMDLKPDNILITIHDKRVHFRTANKHTSGVGTQRYIAPEA
ncbi:unnamed protein product [Oppiella nova]|uniref:Protein kinase domain-containing protein n=1 Tax=Oppiella nova TaxID=334625 RepID=A0A7R9MJ54_9ACAR|nr:unnamed protein product [Oppiella nova]CAG2178317.1 unnamed protein product [Oppiella nova]